MKTFKCIEVGEEERFMEEIEALDADHAAEKYVEWLEREFGNNLEDDGDTANISVTDENGHETIVKVRVEVETTYSYHAIRRVK